jgi:hypothetical protein
VRGIACDAALLPSPRARQSAVTLLSWSVGLERSDSAPTLVEASGRPQTRHLPFRLASRGTTAMWRWLVGVRMRHARTLEVLSPGMDGLPTGSRSPVSMEAVA